MDHWKDFFKCGLMWLTVMRDIGRYAEKANVDARMGRLKIEEFRYPEPAKNKARNRRPENAPEAAATVHWHGARPIEEKPEEMFGVLPNVLNERRSNPTSYDYDASDEGESE